MIKIDPEFQSLIPPLAPEERQQLEANILTDGCRDPLVIWNGVLIDGHNRYEICTKHGIGFETVEKEFADRDAAMDWMDANQLGRRNLSPDAFRLALGRRYNRTKKADGQRGPKKLDQNEPASTAEVLSKQHSVSAATVKRAGKFAEEVEKTPELQKAIAERKPVQQVKREIKVAKREAKEEVREAIAQAIEVQPEATIKVSRGDWWQLGQHMLYCGDTSQTEFTDRLEHAALCFADPPYGAGKEGYDDSAFYWKHDYLINFGEVVVVTPGIVSIFEFAKKTTMPYLWSTSCWINNGMTRGAIGFGNWIYAAVFSEGSVYRNAQDFFQASITTTESGDTKHTTRKPSKYMVWVVELFTKPGDLVIDPFAGSGQTLMVCELTGRNCITGELDPEFCASIISRWQKLTSKKAVRL
jgi:DNA modification methylase